MAVDSKLLFRAFAPKLVAYAVRTFDRATTVVVAACWSAALIATAAAIYSVTLSVSARHDNEAVLAAEPILPKIVRKPMDLKTAQVVFDRMQQRFPDIGIAVHGNDLEVSSNNGARYHQWLTALSYVDTIAPEFHWSLSELCVGSCVNQEMMHAVLKGERISFEAPSQDAP